MIKLTTLLTEAVTVPDLIKQANEKWASLAAQYPIWPLMMEWWAKHPTEKFTKSSLEILAAGGDVNISYIKQAKVDQQAYADKLKVLIDSITTVDAKRTSLENCYKLISAYLKAGAVISPAIGMAWDNATKDIPIDKAAYDAKTEAQLAAAYTKLKGYYSDQGYITGEFSLTEEILGRLLNELTRKVQAKMVTQHEKSWFVDFSFDRMVHEAIRLEIKKGKEVSSSSETKVKGQTPVEPVYEEFTIQFPPVDAKNRNELAKNFMGDNKFTASAAASSQVLYNLQQMKEQIKAMRADPNYKNLKISYINVTAYAQTSTVNTKFGDKFLRSRRENNVALAESRGKAIIKFGVEQVIAAFKIDESKIIKTSPTTKPNVGPEWMSVGGTFADGTTAVTIDNYGPLFRTAYKLNNKITPQQFYAGRNDAAAINASKLLGRSGNNAINAAMLEAEYERVYGAMRMSLLGIKIGLEYNASQKVVADELEFEAVYSNNFTARIDWKVKKKKGGGGGGGGGGRFKRSRKSTVFQPRWTGPTECPIF
jgi:hypothetical protein